MRGRKRVIRAEGVGVFCIIDNTTREETIDMTINIKLAMILVAIGLIAGALTVYAEPASHSQRYPRLSAHRSFQPGMQSPLGGQYSITPRHVPVSVTIQTFSILTWKAALATSQATSSGGAVRVTSGAIWPWATHRKPLWALGCSTPERQ